MPAAPNPDAAPAQLYAQAWDGLWQAVSALEPGDFAEPSGCAGWLVRDLVCHLVIDVQDVLITLATPSDAPATADAAGYWSIVEPPDGTDPLDALIPRLAAAYQDPDLLRFHLEDLGSAARRAVRRADPAQHVRTQEMILRTDDFVGAYVLEWTLHHLDFLVGAPSLPVPSPPSLGWSRRLLEQAIGQALPEPLSDADALRLVTGRRAPAPGDVDLLGPDLASSLPFPLG